MFCRWRENVFCTHVAPTPHTYPKPMDANWIILPFISFLFLLKLHRISAEQETAQCEMKQSYRVTYRCTGNAHRRCVFSGVVVFFVVRRWWYSSKFSRKIHSDTKFKIGTWKSDEKCPRTNKSAHADVRWWWLRSRRFRCTVEMKKSVSSERPTDYLLVLNMRHVTHTQTLAHMVTFRCCALRLVKFTRIERYQWNAHGDTQANGYLTRVETFLNANKLIWLHRKQNKNKTMSEFNPYVFFNCIALFSW